MWLALQSGAQERRLDDTLLGPPRSSASETKSNQGSGGHTILLLGAMMMRGQCLGTGEGSSVAPAFSCCGRTCTPTSTLV